MEGLVQGPLLAKREMKQQVCFFEKVPETLRWGRLVPLGVKLPYPLIELLLPPACKFLLESCYRMIIP